MTRTIALWLLVVTFTALSIQPQAEARSPMSKRTAQASWQVDPIHSMVVFRVRHGVGAFWGRFNEVLGTATLDLSDAGAMEQVDLNLQVPIKGVDSGNGNLDRHLKSPDFFNAVEFPEMTFRSTSLLPAEEDWYTLKGDLTVLGSTKPIEARLKWLGSAASPRATKAGMEVEFTLKRSDFGMTYGVESGALGNSVRLIVGIELVQQKEG